MLLSKKAAGSNSNHPAPEENTLRVGLVGPLPPPSGGMANQTRQLMELLVSRGIAVTLVRVNEPYRPAWVGKLKGIRAVPRLMAYIARLRRVARQVDVLHVMANSGWSWHLFAAPALWIAWLNKVPVVLNYRGGEAERFFVRSMRWIRPSLEKASLIAVPSGFLQAVFGRFGFDTTVVPNIVDLKRFRPKPELSPLYTQRPHIVIARNLEPIYGLTTALRAFALLLREKPGARLSIAGSGPQRQELEDLALALGIGQNVTFTGRLSPDEMAELYRQADVMLNPTTVDNMPNSILEGMASGLPIVSTHVGGVPYMVEHEKTALLVPPEDPDAMSEQLVRVTSDMALYKSLAENGLAEVTRYGIDAIVPEWVRIYCALAGYDSALSESW
ncbi:glycosyltransferase family 4 protein [Methylocaldum sp. RMAD-M]|uniref:glycosyltransferase family 4 protein n=1 Tax=Methylocaldum sp. RMAD-M TaxID=2806557 RepID=UPI000A326B2B|nr:glycosyltransferase family 4 protein [Methylocaldum sp. RMAD-M]MBP1150026.1 glycosyltransferase involved in cell wall biosynthesis [Methylocaldum sp. RMAD-M]